MDFKITQAALPYKWTWADAAARNAQVVTDADVGAVGFETDIQLRFRLAAQSGGVGTWQPLEPLNVHTPRGLFSAYASPAYSTTGLQAALQSGTLTAGTLVGARPVLSLPRTGARSAASAGSVGLTRSSGAAYPRWDHGGHHRFVFVVEEVCNSLRWFIGLAANSPFAAGADPGGAVADCIGVGRSGAGETQMQLYRNDAAGSSTKVAVAAGTAFPPATAGIGYLFHLYVAPGGLSVGWFLRNLNTGAEVSGALSTDLPTTTSLPLFQFFAYNNADAVQVNIAVCELVNWMSL